MTARSSIYEYCDELKRLRNNALDKILEVFKAGRVLNPFTPEQEALTDSCCVDMENLEFHLNRLRWSLAWVLFSDRLTENAHNDLLKHTEGVHQSIEYLINKLGAVEELETLREVISPLKTELELKKPITLLSTN